MKDIPADHPTREVAALAKKAASSMEGLIELAKAGDRGVARQLLALFAYRQLHPDDLGRQRTHQPALLDYLAECFNDILRGMPADKALRLTAGTKGRPEASLYEKEEFIGIAVAVAALRRAGQTLETAVQTIADERHKSASSVKKAGMPKQNMATVDKTKTKPGPSPPTVM